MESYIVRINQRDNEKLASVLETTQGEAPVDLFYQPAGTEEDRRSEAVGRECPRSVESAN